MNDRNPDLTGTPRIEADWFTTFASQLRTVQTLRNFGGEVDLLLLGDSITAGMQWSPACNQLFAGRRTLNFGIGGDETRHLLWHIDHGLLDGIRPKLITLLIGINDLWYKPQPHIAGTAARIAHITQRLHQLSLQSKIVHLAILPTAGHAANHNPLITQVNTATSLTSLQHPAVISMDLTRSFLDATGQASIGLLPDGVHLAESGYEILASSFLRFLP